MSTVTDAPSSDIWFALSPAPMMEADISGLADALVALRARLGGAAPSAADIAGLRAAHRTIVLHRANGAALRFFGTDDPLLTAQWPQIVDAVVGRSLTDDHYATMLGGHGHPPIEVDFHLPDNRTRRAVVHSGTPMRGHSRDLKRCALVFEDRTAERELQRHWFDDSPVAMLEADFSELVGLSMRAFAEGARGDALRAAIAEGHKRFRVLRMNTALERLSQRDFGTFTADLGWFLTPSNLAAAVEAMFDSMSRGANQRPWHGELMRPDGSVRHVLVLGRQVPGHANWERAFLSFTDVTVTRTAELAAIKRAEAEAARSRATFDHSVLPQVEADLGCMLGWYHEGTQAGLARGEWLLRNWERAVAEAAAIPIQALNEAAAELLGVDRAAVLEGRRVLVDAAMLRGLHAAAVDGTLFTESNSLTFTATHTRPCGAVREIIVRARPFPGFEEDWARCSIALMDVTALREAERAVSQSIERNRAHWHALFEESALPQMTSVNLVSVEEVQAAIASGEARAGDWSLAQLSARGRQGTQGRLLNRAARDLFGLGDGQAFDPAVHLPDDYWQAFSQAANDWNPADNLLPFEAMVRRTDGSMRDVIVTLRSMPGAKGGETLLASTFVDVTDLRQTQRRVQAEAEVRAAEWATLFQDSSIAQMVWDASGLMRLMTGLRKAGV